MKVLVWTLLVKYNQGDPPTVCVVGSQADAEALYRENYDADPDVTIDDDAASQGLTVWIDSHHVDVELVT